MIQRVNILFMKKDVETDSESSSITRKVGVHTCYFAMDPKFDTPMWEMEYMNDSGVVTGHECIPYNDWEIIAISPYYPED